MTVANFQIKLTYNFPFVQVREIDHPMGIDKLRLLYSYVLCWSHIDNRTDVGVSGAEPDGYWYVVLCTYSTKVILIKGSQQQDILVP